MSGFTVLAVPYFFQAGQSSTSFAVALLMFMATAPPRLHDDLGPVLAELGLGDPYGLRHVLMRERRVDDFVAVIRQVRRLHAADRRVPAVEEENGGHGRRWLSFAGSLANLCFVVT